MPATPPVSGTPRPPPKKDATLFSEYVQRYLANDHVREWLLCRDPERVRHASTFHNSLSYACYYYVPSKRSSHSQHRHQQDKKQQQPKQNKPIPSSTPSTVFSPPGTGNTSSPMQQPHPQPQQQDHPPLPRPHSYPASSTTPTTRQSIASDACLIATSSRTNNTPPQHHPHPSLAHPSTISCPGPNSKQNRLPTEHLPQPQQQRRRSAPTVWHDVAEDAATHAKPAVSNPDFGHHPHPPTSLPYTNTPTSNTKPSHTHTSRPLSDRYAQPAPFLDSGDLMIFHATHDNFAVGSLYTTREHHALAQLRDSVEETGLSTIPKSRRFASDMSVDALEIMEFAWLMDDSLIVSCRKLQKPTGARPERDNMLAIQGDILFYDIIPKDQHPGTPLKRMRLYERPVMCSCCGSRGFTQCTCPMSFKRRAPSSDLAGNPSRKLLKIAANQLAVTSATDYPSTLSQHDVASSQYRIPDRTHATFRGTRPYSEASPSAAPAGEHPDTGPAVALGPKIQSEQDRRDGSHSQQHWSLPEPDAAVSRPTVDQQKSLRQARLVGDGALVDDCEDQLGPVVPSTTRHKGLATFANLTSRLFSIDQSGSFFVQWYVRVPNSRHMRSWVKPRNPIPYQFICGTRKQTNILSALFIADMQLCANSFQNDARFYGSLTTGADIGMLVSKEDDSRKDPIRPPVVDQVYDRNTYFSTVVVANSAAPVLKYPTHTSIRRSPSNEHQVRDLNTQEEIFSQRGDARPLRHSHITRNTLNCTLSSGLNMVQICSDDDNGVEIFGQSIGPDGGPRVPSILSEGLVVCGNPAVQPCNSIDSAWSFPAATVEQMCPETAFGSNMIQTDKMATSHMTDRRWSDIFSGGLQNEIAGIVTDPPDVHVQSPGRVSLQDRDESTDSGSDSICRGASAKLSDADDCGRANTEGSDDREKLQRYIVVGADGIPACRDCGASFRKTGNLTRHIQTVHLKRKPFACEQCNSTFGYKTHLIRHIQTVHNKTTEFKCPCCNREFRTQQQLDRHFQQAHVNSAPVEGESFQIRCDICGNGFSQRSNLNRHIQSIHEGMRHNCSVCSSSFGQRFDLQRHVQRYAENGDPDHIQLLESIRNGPDFAVRSVVN